MFQQSLPFRLEEAKSIRGWHYVCTICGNNIKDKAKIILVDRMPGIVIGVDCAKKLAQFVKEQRL